MYADILTPTCSTDLPFSARHVTLTIQQTTQKEQFMLGVRDFLVNSRQAMIDYILVVSTSTPDKFPIPGCPDMANSDRKERSQVIESLRSRGANMPLLNREAIPLLPHLLDVPRHLAVISSAVVRRSNELLAKHQANGTLVDPELDEFVNKCLEIEQQALKRVSRLAAHTRELRKRKVATSASAADTTSSSQTGGVVRPSTSGDSYFTTSQRPSTATSVTNQKSARNLKHELRPSTATTYSDSQPTFGSVASRKRPSTAQGNGNIYEVTPLRPRSAARAVSSPPKPIRVELGQDMPSLQGVTKTPDKIQSTKTPPKLPRPILKRPSTAPSPSLLPMLAPSPELPQLPSSRSRSTSQATGWSMFSSILSTPKKDKEAKRRLPRFSADDSTRRYPPSPENTDSPPGEKRKGFSFRGFLSRK
jgi:hypothetical protein